MAQTLSFWEETCDQQWVILKDEMIMMNKYIIESEKLAKMRYLVFFKYL